MLEKDIKKVLFSQEDIVAKTKELGQQLTKDYEGKNPLLVGVLKGAVPFMAELIKHIDTHLEMDFMVVSSYGGGTVSSGEVRYLRMLIPMLKDEISSLLKISLTLDVPSFTFEICSNTVKQTQ